MQTSSLPLKSATLSREDKYQRIWQTINSIPKGKVASYGQIADLAGLPKRARLVGRSLGFVPQDVQVNWHRVVRSNGQIAFAPHSEQAKIQSTLLREEGVLVLKNRINMRDFAWSPSLTDILYRLSF